jgi:hypothetical protein
MRDFFTKVLDKFRHPIGLLLFVLGAILILLSVSQGLKIPGLENIVSEPSYRVTSLVIGSLLVLSLDHDLASRSIAVAGKTILASGFEGPDESLIDQKALIIDSTKCGHERSSIPL